MSKFPFDNPSPDAGYWITDHKTARPQIADHSLLLGGFSIDKFSCVPDRKEKKGRLPSAQCNRNGYTECKY